MARAAAAVERGQAATAIDQLAPLLRNTGSLSRADELVIRSALAEAYLLQGDLTQASTAVGRSPDTIRESDPAGHSLKSLAAHGRVAFARGDQSRAIALHGRALKQAEIAHDSRAIGLAHYELGLCYRKVGDMSIVREHIAKAAAALHAAGDRRYLALVHSLSAHRARADRAASTKPMAALRQAERLADRDPGRRRAGDGLRQSGQRRADSASPRAGAGAGRARRGPARRHRARGTGLAVVARDARTDLRAARRSRARRRSAAPRARRAQRGPVPRDHRRRLRHAGADLADARRLRVAPANTSAGPAKRTAPTAADRAAGTSGRCACSTRGWRAARRARTKRWRLPTRSRARRRPRRPRRSQAELIAAEALLAGRSHRRGRASAGAGARAASIRAPRRARGASSCGSAATSARRAVARHRGVPRHRAERERLRAASASAIRPRSAISRSAAWRPRPGARVARRTPLSTTRPQVFQALGADARSRETLRGARWPPRRRRARARTSAPRPTPTTPSCGDLVDAAVLPELLARETAPRPCSKPSAPTARSCSSQLPGGDIRVVACGRRRCRRRQTHRARWPCRAPRTAPGVLITERLGRDSDGPRTVARGLVATGGAPGRCGGCG